MTGAVDARHYLARLGVTSQPPPPSVEALAALQLDHLVVPFKNLDVFDLVDKPGPRDHGRGPN